MNDLDKRVIKLYNEDNLSTYEIAKQLETYPNKIRRILVKHGCELKDKSSAQKAALKSAFKQIPERMREALYLKTYQQLTYKEIALIMRVRPQVARNYVSEAFKRLRDILSN